MFTLSKINHLLVCIEWVFDDPSFNIEFGPNKIKNWTNDQFKRKIKQTNFLFTIELCFVVEFVWLDDLKE